MNKSLLIFILIGICLPFKIWAQTLSPITYKATLPVYDNNKLIGETLVELEGEKLNWIDRDTLVNALQTYLQQEIIQEVRSLPDRLTPEILPFPLKFNPEELKLETSIDLNQRQRRSTDLGMDLEDEKRLAIKPAPFGGAVNFRLEKNWGAERLGGDSFTGQFNSFINFHSFVFENQTYYQDNLENRWYRGDTRLVKDFQEHDIRVQAGDIYPQIQGFMAPRPLGGINIQRNFSLNPYRLPYPTGHQNFTLKSRSFVKYYVNSVLIKSEYLQAGNYSAKDIPLNNGLNTVMIEATDDLGQKQVFVFKSSSDINLLNEGESRFDLSYGLPFFERNYKREYTDEDGKVFSGFFQYGISSIFSSSVYLQNQGNFNLYGSDLINATPVGNITLGLARSSLNEKEGNAASLGYQLITQGRKWFHSQTLAIRYESRSEGFITSLMDTNSPVKNNYSANYTVPISNLLTFSVGGNYGEVRGENLADRYGHDVNLSFRISNHHNIAFYASRNRDEFKNWNDLAYVYLTLSIPESNHYVSGLYDQKLKSTRVNVLRDNQNKLYTFRTQGIAEYSEERQNGELDLVYPTQVADFGGRIVGNSTNAEETATRGSLNINSSLVFAYQNQEFGMGVSRPIYGSLVIFKPEERLSDQKIALKSSSPYTESQTGLLNEIVFSNLIPYQYRDVQLDPTYLDRGRTLAKERFILFPTYRSVHLVKLAEKGAVILSGRLVNPDGSPIALQVGRIGEIVFFTNRDGEFFVEGIEQGQHKLSLEGREHGATFSISKDDRGMVNLGELKIKENEL